PIRPTAIRGQLQFWWRATIGAQYDNKEELRKEQSAVWGDTSRASPVQVRVEVIDKGNHQRFLASSFKHTALPYVLFPFQGDLANPAQFVKDTKFQLIVSWTKDIDFAKQVEPAIWAWVNFGGLGSRTRRGCGAIFCQQLAPRDTEDLMSAWQQFLPEPFPTREWPTLAERILTNQNQDSAINAWDWVIDLFSHFRQGKGKGRNPGQQSSRPGRSRYPEAETIRTIPGMPPSKHPRLTYIPNDAFPRAEFGLPIVFHFQGNGEPPETTLYPDNDASGQERERMASPLILKPLGLQNGKSIPLILHLKTTELTGVDLRHKKVSKTLPSTTVIRDRRLSNYFNSPLADSPNGSAIEAFLAFARAEGFSEVKR
ncbi:MAG: type III-B CRISPR module RAMP protein Cmr1, partial [Blastocatellia bacterium]